MTHNDPGPTEIGTFQAAGQIINQVYQRIAYEAIRGAARAAITAMKTHATALGLRPCQRATEVVRQSSSDRVAGHLTQSFAYRLSYQVHFTSLYYNRYGSNYRFLQYGSG